MPKRSKEEKELVAAARKKMPKCQYCGKLMEPHYVTEWDKRDMTDGFVHVGRIVGVRGYGYASKGLFCSLRCGYYWAVRALTGKSK